MILYFFSFFETDKKEKNEYYYLRLKSTLVTN